LAPKKITVNAILAGVTDTPALRKIPGHERMIEIASKSNPHGRLTTPQDVAEAISLLVQPGASWITGDGGGQVVAKGTPEDVARVAKSYTGQYLKRALKIK
jgi:NAD(P)-dependent dehydrogenase (short-subunit alcohol dehydrogenase family)